MKTNDPNEKLTDPRRAEWSSGKEAMEIQCEHGADERGADSCVAPCSAFARRCGYSPGVGTSRAMVECACGWKQGIFLWSWAGHGKARCAKCRKWICYLTLQVFECREELAWWRKLHAPNSHPLPNLGK